MGSRQFDPASNWAWTLNNFEQLQYNLQVNTTTLQQLYKDEDVSEKSVGICNIVGHSPCCTCRYGCDHQQGPVLFGLWSLGDGAKLRALVQFRTGPKADVTDGIKHTAEHAIARAVHAPAGSSTLFRQSSAWCETALAPGLRSLAQVFFHPLPPNQVTLPKYNLPFCLKMAILKMRGGGGGELPPPPPPPRLICLWSPSQTRTNFIYFEVKVSQMKLKQWVINLFN